MGWGRLLLRHLGASVGRWLVLALVVSLTSAAVMAWPRWLEANATAEIRRDLAASSFVDPVAVSPSIYVFPFQSAPTLEAAESAAWAGVQHALDAVRLDAPDSIRPLIGEPGMYSLVAGPTQVPDARVTDVQSMTIRAFTSPGFLDRVAFVTGRAPAFEPLTDENTRLPLPGEEGYEDFALPPVEVALSVAAAAAMRWEAGTTRTVTTAYWGDMPVVLTGTYTSTPASDEARWTDQAVALFEPTIVYTPFQEVLIEARAYIPFGAALFTFTATETMSSPPLTLVWFPLDLSGITLRHAEALASWLRELQATAVTLDTGAASFATDAPAIIDAVIARQSATNAVLGLAVAAPAGVLVILLALAATVIVRPRRTALALMAARGLAPAQRRALLSAEAALVSVPAAAIGGGAAVLLLPSYASPWWWAAPAVIAAAPVAALALGSDGVAMPRFRAAGELVVALVTIAATVTLLTTRGVGGPGRGSDPADAADPLALVTPLLLAVCVALASVRLLPVLLRPLAARLRVRRDLVAPLGATLASRRRAPLASTIAIVTGAAVAVLGQVATATVDHGLRAAAMADVGADVRLTGRLTAEEVATLESLPGIAAVTTVASPATPGSVLFGDAFASVTVYAVDPAGLARVQQHTPGGLTVPALDETAGVTGIVVSGSTDLPVGAVGELVLGSRLAVEVVEVAERAPGLANAGTWIAIDAEALRAAGIDLVPRTTLVAYDESIGASGGGGTGGTAGAGPPTRAEREAAIGAVVTDRVSLVSVDSRITTYAEAPTAQALRAGLTAVSALGVLAAVVAILLTLAGANESRTRLVSVLRTLGLPPRAELRLVLWEIAPTAGTGLVLGAGLGLGLAALLVGVTDLRAFTGGRTQPELVIAPLGLTLTLLGVALAVVAAVVIAAWAAGRRSAAVVLRVGEGSS